MSEQYVTKDTPVDTRVQCVDSYEGNEYVVGKEGVVIFNDGEDCAVEFDGPFACGHNGDGRGRDGHCWYFPVFPSDRFLVVTTGEVIFNEAINALLLGGE